MPPSKKFARPFCQPVTWLPTMGWLPTKWAALSICAASATNFSFTDPASVINAPGFACVMTSRSCMRIVSTGAHRRTKSARETASAMLVVSSSTTPAFTASAMLRRPTAITRDARPCFFAAMAALPPRRPRPTIVTVPNICFIAPSPRSVRHTPAGRQVHGAQQGVPDVRPPAKCDRAGPRRRRSAP